jgi:hypothetical protein
MAPWNRVKQQGGKLLGVYGGKIWLYDSGEQCGPWASSLIYLLNIKIYFDIWRNF